jgi:hypothetical protein
MQFELHLTCTKDVNKLAIDFADGSSVTQFRPEAPVPDSGTQNAPSYSKGGELLDTDGDFGTISQEVVELPDTTRLEKPVKVADELQNLNL